MTAPSDKEQEDTKQPPENTVGKPMPKEPVAENTPEADTKGVEQQGSVKNTK